jgi:hypothetical protein
MGGTSEREFRQKMNKMREKVNKKSQGTKKEFINLEKTKVNLLKRTEEDRHKIVRELDKMERKIYGSKDLAPESKRRLYAETNSLKLEIQNVYVDLKTRISETLIPA